MPLTSHTSPWAVQTAASPFGRKSMAVRNMSARNGLSYGTVSVSSASGPSLAPSWPLVSMGARQHRRHVVDRAVPQEQFESAGPFARRNGDCGVRALVEIEGKIVGADEGS